MNAARRMNNTLNSDVLKLQSKYKHPAGCHVSALHQIAPRCVALPRGSLAVLHPRCAGLRGLGWQLNPSHLPRKETSAAGVRTLTTASATSGRGGPDTSRQLKLVHILLPPGDEEQAKDLRKQILDGLSSVARSYTCRGRHGAAGSAAFTVPIQEQERPSGVDQGGTDGHRLHTVLLVVNVASYCGLTDSNYKGLVELYSKYRESGLEILAFPCNQFNAQEPRSNEEVTDFARDYGAYFPMFAKVTVNGPCAREGGQSDIILCGPRSDACCPANVAVYARLKEAFPADVEWNFAKGAVVKRYHPHVPPMDLEDDIRSLLMDQSQGHAQWAVPGRMPAAKHNSQSVSDEM
eukprot:jgi/Mesvir1/16498/Mv10051-RA.1